MSELIENLGIDWKLLLANAITFFIVLWLLRKFAFGPLLAVIEKRQKTVADSLTQAARTEEAAEEADVKRAALLKKARAEASKILTAAKKESEEWHEQVKAKAQHEAADITDRARQALEQEKQHMVQAARSELAGLVVSATEKIISQHLDQKVETKLAQKALAAMEKSQ